MTDTEKLVVLGGGGLLLYLLTTRNSATIKAGPVGLSGPGVGNLLTGLGNYLGHLNPNANANQQPKQGGGSGGGMSGGGGGAPSGSGGGGKLNPCNTPIPCNFNSPYGLRACSAAGCEMAIVSGMLPGTPSDYSTPNFLQMPAPGSLGGSTPDSGFPSPDGGFPSPDAYPSMAPPDVTSDPSGSAFDVSQVDFGASQPAVPNWACTQPCPSQSWCGSQGTCFGSCVCGGGGSGIG